MKNALIKLLNDDAQVPEYAHVGDSGADLFASEDVTIYPGETKVVPTGLSIMPPDGYEIQVRPRGGMSLKTPMLIKNSPGTVDNGYRGEIGVIAHCMYTSKRDENGEIVHCNEALHIKKGDKVAQAVFAPFEQVAFTVVDELDRTDRGAGAYGSTGM
jgi:dUTP pyrophosphatase